MATTFTLGDSIARGIGAALGAGTRNYAVDAAHIPDMAAQFGRANSEVQSGDTVIISAGYNDAGANGLSDPQRTQLQGWVQQLRGKGAVVVLAGLRTRGMTGDYAPLNDTANNAPGPASKVNTQLRAIATATGAVMSDECTRISNARTDGEIHGDAVAYARLGRSCYESAYNASATANGTSTGTAGGGTSAEADRVQNSRNNSGGGFWAWIMDNIINPLLRLLGIGGSETSTATADATPTADAPASTNTNPDAARAAARDAASGTRVTGGTTADRAASLRPIPPAAGPLVAAAATVRR